MPRRKHYAGGGAGTAICPRTDPAAVAALDAIAASRRRPPMFSHAAGANRTKARSGYELLPSVWHADDARLLEQMLDFYPRQPPQRILDATVNRGRFWAGRSRPVTGLDIDPRYK